MLSFTYLTSCTLYFCQENSVRIVCGEVWFVVCFGVFDWHPKYVLSQPFFFPKDTLMKAESFASRKTIIENSVCEEPGEQKILWIPFKNIIVMDFRDLPFSFLSRRTTNKQTFWNEEDREQFHSQSRKWLLF